MSFRLVSKWVTSNDLERRNDGPYLALFLPNSAVSGAHCIKVVEDIPTLSATENNVAQSI